MSFSKTKLGARFGAERCLIDNQREGVMLEHSLGCFGPPWPSSSVLKVSKGPPKLDLWFKLSVSSLIPSCRAPHTARPAGGLFLHPGSCRAPRSPPFPCSLSWLGSNPPWISSTTPHLACCLPVVLTFRCDLPSCLPDPPPPPVTVYCAGLSAHAGLCSHHMGRPSSTHNCQSLGVFCGPTWARQGRMT